MGKAGAPGIWYVCVVVNGGVGHVDGKKVEADFLGEIIALAVAKIVSRARGVGLARVLLLIRVAAEVVFLFKKQPVFAAKEVSGGESGGACTHNDDVGIPRGVRLGERMALANLVADGVVLAFERNGAGIVVVRERNKGFVDRATGGDGARDSEFDEVTARMRHANEPS